MSSTKEDNRGSFSSKRIRNDASRKDGDWTCPNCGNLNFSFRTVCNQGRCGAPRPPLTPPALITSPYRNNHPFYYGGFAIPSPSYRMPGQFGSLIPHLGMKYDYGLYATPGAPYGPLPMFPPGSFGGPDGLSEGDWICPNCENVNFAFRTTCNIKHCGAARPSSNKPSSTVIPEGSWTCEKCGNLNYPFRNVCNRKDCRTDKKVSV
ncbi:ranBP2-type zinc finger protein At1g67325 isoform X2 [Vigna angularis]|uniref:ranBP2-type zinc finger protein At1g67325 isoform X2 n=1 Tax=Phaseolus angularis TaxID=3914 RepID=UPI000809B510|nr:ranBP2-type zinc finger protein At1g67325 isoform X2 [Vigna angularis]